MAARGPALGLTLLLGCGGEAADTGAGWFHVVSMAPEPGATDALDATIPTLELDGEADPATCGSGSLLFLGVNDDGTVAFEVDATLTFGQGGKEVRFQPERLLLHGARYAVVVRDWPEPCTSLDGRILAPFAGEFEVP